MNIHLRKKICIGVGMLFLLCGCFYIKTEYGALWEKNDEMPIMTDENIIDLGNHIIAYQTSSAQKLNQWAEGQYIVICDLDTGRENIFLLPDIYGQIYDLQVKRGDFIYIRYKEANEANMCSAYIPVHFVSPMDYAINSTYDGKILAELEDDKGENMTELPKLIWRETAAWGENEYTVMFKRISLAYNIGATCAGELCADYCITVQDSEDDIIFQQTMTGYPIAYERTYWMADFSGDGFPDIAFCIFYDEGWTEWTGIEFMIWNAENKVYEPKQFPGKLISKPLWNELYESVICVNEREHTLDMYAFRDKDWELTGQLLPVYEENQEGFLKIQYYKEVFYTDEEMIEGNIIMPETDNSDVWNEILSDEESFWRNSDERNILLYPCGQEWGKKAVTIGGEVIEKYERISRK